MACVGILVGFVVGRLGDRWGGNINAPHHWIYGIALVFIGVVYVGTLIGALLFYLGVGHFVSDLEDFLHMRVWGADKPHKWRFWSLK